MREIRTSGLMSGGGKRGDANLAQATAPVLDSTQPSRTERDGGDGHSREARAAPWSVRPRELSGLVIRAMTTVHQHEAETAYLAEANFGKALPPLGRGEQSPFPCWSCYFKKR